MKRGTKIIVRVLFLALAILILVFLSRIIPHFADIIVRLFYLVAIVGLSIYKLLMWFRYRKDPEKREQVVYSTQIYPEKVRRFLMDEKPEKK